MGTRDRLMLVEVDGQRLLLGVSGNGIQPLHVYAAPAENPASFESALSASATESLKSAPL
ncbi:MAG: flagellar biosynthetic protein FliO [Pseudomonadota bacterium]